MTSKHIADRALDYVRLHPDGVSDKEVYQGIPLKHRAQANRSCRTLADAGLIERRTVNGRIFNVPKPLSQLSAACAPAQADSYVEPWYWEGSVQGSLVRHLETDGWTCTAANTASGQHGVDIEAVRTPDETLLIEVKGYPKTVYQRGPKRGQPKPTNPGLQARHWYAGALLTALLRMAETPNARFGLSFPDKPTYRTLISKTAHSLQLLGLEIYLVAEDGAVKRIL